MPHASLPITPLCLVCKPDVPKTIGFVPNRDAYIWGLVNFQGEGDMAGEEHAGDYPAHGLLNAKSALVLNEEDKSRTLLLYIIYI